MPSARLNNRTIEAHTTGARTELWDTEVKGLYVSIFASGSRTFMVKYRAEGQQRKVKLGRFGALTVEQARKLARATLADVAKGADPQADRRRARQGLTVAAAFARFIDEPGKRGPRKPRTTALYRQLYRDYIERRLGASRLDAVERRDVERLRVAVAKEPGPEVANRVLALLSALMTAAERWGERPTASNPCRGVDRFEEQGRERFLQPAERARLARVLDAADDLSPGAVLCIRLLALTGCRRSEIETLTWGMVDSSAACLRLPDSKTGRKVVQLAPQAAALLATVRPHDAAADVFVCQSKVGTQIRNVGRVWAIVRDRAELPGVRLHDLRHSFASDALNAGAPLSLVGALLGHRNPRTTSRYAHVADDALRRAAEAAGNAIEAATRQGAEVIPFPSGGRSR